MASEMREAIDDALRRILESECTPALVRTVERGGSAESLWTTLEDSGFFDGLVPEHAGGAGLAVADILPVLFLSGEFAVPAPLAETVLARAVLAQAGTDVPNGGLTLTIGEREADGGIRSLQVHHFGTSTHALVGCGEEFVLLPVHGALREPTGSPLETAVAWSSATAAAAPSTRPTISPRHIAAYVHAGQLAGALMKIFRMALSYANERKQFGRPIGTFQAVQHQLSLAAEHIFAARMAVELAAGDGALPDPLSCAVAKARTSEAAAAVTAIVHAVHGAIGFTEEYDLQLYTRRIASWRMAAGSERFWQREVGKALINRSDIRTLDFIREIGSTGSGPLPPPLTSKEQEGIGYA